MKIFTSVTFAAAICLASHTAQAATINFAALPALCLGSSVCTDLGVEGDLLLDLSASGGRFGLKTLNGATGLGVTGGDSGNEIDLGQSISGTFSAPTVVTAFRLLFLYNGPEFLDYNREIARVSWSGNNSATIITTAADNTIALSGFALGASWSNCGSTTASGTGCFDIYNPFAGAISAFTFRPVDNGAWFTSNSDFGLSTMTTATAVPEPGSMILLGTGLLGLARAVRRRRAA